MLVRLGSRPAHCFGNFTQLQPYFTGQTFSSSVLKTGQIGKPTSPQLALAAMRAYPLLAPPDPQCRPRLGVLPRPSEVRAKRGGGAGNTLPR